MDDDFEVPVESQVRYINRRITELRSVVVGEAVDFELAKTIGHQTKGNAENFGFENLIERAKQLEFAASNADKVAVGAAVQGLLVALREHLKRLEP